jgi:hypothetical protein
MHYQISRNGQMYGPYTLEDLRRYLTSGNVLLTDMAKSDEMPDWVPVSQLLQTAAPLAGGGFATPGFNAQAQTSYMPATTPMDPGALAASPYQDPPNLHWGLVLLFGFLTCTLFMWIWNLIVASWLKRVQPNATSLFYYGGALVLLLVQIMVTVPYSMHHAMEPGLHTSSNPLGGLIGLAVWVVRLIARFSQRASLEEHFNGPEPVGLQLNPVMTFFFGGIYFQYHLNRINLMKQAARYGRTL